MVKQRVSTEESVLLMSPQVIYGHPGPRLECIHRGEVQGTLTEYSSSAWQIGDVVGYAPMEKLRKTFNAKSFFTDWSGFTWYVLGPLLRVVLWAALFFVLASPILFRLGFIRLNFGGGSVAMEEMFIFLLIPFFYFPSLILLVHIAGICFLCVVLVKFLKALKEAAKSIRLLVRQHKIQQDFQFRLVYECTPLDGSSPATLLYGTDDEEES